MSKNSNPTIEKRVYEIILEAIVQRKLTPGMKISALSLSQQIGVSRTPVRLALQQLSAEGFVVMQSNRAAQVAKPSEKNIREIYFMRGLLESEAIVLACANAKKRDIKKLRELAKLERKMFGARNLAGYASANEQFHLEIARLAQNEILFETIKKFIAQSNIIISLFDRFYEFSKSDEIAYAGENEKLISLIEKRDEKRASMEMKNHVRRSFEGLALDRLKEVTSMVPAL
jgi:DNA-binding GntR family transcriptional regulator